MIIGIAKIYRYCMQFTYIGERRLPYSLLSNILMEGRLIGTYKLKLAQTRANMALAKTEWSSFYAPDFCSGNCLLFERMSEAP